jgi:ATP-dependent DNA helicase RecQ
VRERGLGTRLEAAMTASAKALGYGQLTNNQRKVLRSFLLGSDVFASLPTGSGKPLCYWVLPGAFNVLRKINTSIVLIVSPLIALMKDQVERLKVKRVKAVYAGSDQCEMDRVYEGYYQMIFLSPESLLTTNKWRDILLSDVYQRNLVAVVIDEAHCVKKW